jgi:TolA-binding protein
VIVLPNPEHAGSPAIAPETPAIAPEAPGGQNTASSSVDAVTSSSGVGDGRSEPARTDGNHKGDHKRTPPRVAATIRRNTSPPPAGDDRSVAALVSRAKAFEKEGQWNEARATYQKLEKVKGYPQGEALYHQAYAAIQANATEEAARLAALAVRLPGPFKTPAMFLYGDAWFRQHEYSRAKDIYITLRKTTTADDRTTATKKIVACNKALGLPERDGVVD